MNKKGISMLVVVAIIVIVVVVGGIAVYYLMTSGGENGNGNGEIPDIEGATSIKFDVEATIEGATETDKFTAKNLGTDNVLLRVDQTDADGNEFIYLMNQTAQTAWANVFGEWMDVSDDWATYWDSSLIGSVALCDYMDALVDGWDGTGDYEFTSNGDTFVISNIIVDPTIDDSVFQPD